MVSNPWHTEGQSEITARWCTVLPELSTDPDEDLTGIANDYERTKAILERYRARFARLAPDGVGSGLTGISVWAPLSAEERSTGRGPLFALSRGVPSGLSPHTGEKPTGIQLDSALYIGVPDESYLPRGPLFLDGVPLVVHVLAPHSIRPLSPNGLKAA